MARRRVDRQMLVNVVVGSGAAVLLLLRAYDGAGSMSSFLEFTLIGISGGCVDRKSVV